MNLENQVKAVISITFNLDIDSVNEDSSSDRVSGWDSLGHLRLVIALEQAFDIVIKPEHFIKMIDYKGVVEVVESNVRARKTCYEQP